MSQFVFSHGYLQRQTCKDSISFNSAIAQRDVMKYDVIHYKMI